MTTTTACAQVQSENGANRSGFARGNDKAQQARDSIDQRIEALAKAVDAERASAEFQAYLDVQARFHNYSWHNGMLIYSQRPDATCVAGFRAWQKLARHVRKGERGIVILAPCSFKRKVVDEETGEETDRNRVYFKAVHVFDVAQTDGDALPDYDVPEVGDAADGLLARLHDVAAARGIRVERTDVQPGHYGTSRGGVVELANGLPSGQAAKTLAHELAHEALHKGKGRPSGLTRTVAELEAESVGYVVCRHAGLDVGVRASWYIALWGGDGKGLRASLDRIAQTARALIDDADDVAADDHATRKAVA